jgi:4-hydroxy-tetrahydrodipicolinate synthase
VAHPEHALPDGVFTASLTPVNADFSVDVGLLLEHVQWLLSNGCDGIVLFGTTGEANSLAHAERMAGLDPPCRRC